MSDSHAMYNFSNPKRVGPGTWMMFMIMSANSQPSQSSRLWVCKQIRLFVDYFGCGMCVPHAQKKLLEDPPENYISTNRELFGWVVEFMNSVNVRLGKKLYDEQILWERFSSKEFKTCESGCESRNSHNSVKREESIRGHRGFRVVTYGL